MNKEKEKQLLSSTPSNKNSSKTNQNFGSYLNKAPKKFLGIFNRKNSTEFVDVSNKLQFNRNKKNMNSVANRYAAILRLLFRSWSQQLISPISAYLVPAIGFTIVYLFNKNSAPTFHHHMLAMWILIAVINVNIAQTPVFLLEYRKSSLIKRIATTPLSKSDFLICILIFNCLITLSSVIFLTIFAFIFYHKGMSFSLINWGFVLLGIIFLIITSSSIGLFVSSISPTVTWANGISGILVAIFIGSSFLFILPQMYIKDPGSTFHWIQFATHFSPFSYITKILLYGFAKQISMGGYDANVTLNWMDFVIPILFTLVFIAISFKAIKFE